MPREPLRAAIVGMGGFARQHQSALKALEEMGECQLIASCDPHLEQFGSEQDQWHFAERGVQVYPDYIEMLDAHRHQLDFVTLPVPIPLHAPMHRMCAERELAVYLEKPPTLSWAELEAMIEVDQQARHATQVGFNFIAEQPRQALKQRLLDGEFGPLRCAGFLGHWPRATKYFERAPWAGRLMIDNRLVLDSCVGNAMAHFIHNLLFWCGPDKVLSWGEVQQVEAELYRTHHIESFDTIFARGRCAGDIEIRVAATHAASGASHHREWIECEDATITYHTGAGYSIQWRDGREENGEADRRNLLLENLRFYARYLRGEEERVLTRLEDTRPFVHLNNLFFIAANRIASINEEHLQRASTKNGNWIQIAGIEEALEAFANEGQLPGEMNLPWSHRGGRATIADLAQLESTVRRLHAAV